MTDKQYANILELLKLMLYGITIIIIYSCRGEAEKLWTEKTKMLDLVS